MRKIILTAIFILFSARLVQAAGATFSIAPASGAFNAGQTVKTTIFIHSGGNAVNAAEGTLNFPAAYLRVAAITKANSVFSLWAVDPRFDNGKGTVTFAGGTVTPFSGTKEEALTIIFHVKQAGEGTLNFSGARILLADGLGTNIFAGASSAAWRFIPAPPTKPAVMPAQLPAVPEISSPTHSDSEKWFANNNPKFIWPVPPGVDAVRVLYDQFSDTEPTIIYEPPISERELGGAADGIWYFHVQFRNSRGWGKAAHFKARVDTVSPEPFAIQFLDGRKTYKTQPLISFEAKDSLSGIERYEIKIGDGDWFDPEILRKDSYYILPRQSLGEHLIIVRAFDKAGNMTIAYGSLAVLPMRQAVINTAIAILLLLAVFLIIKLIRFQRKTSRRLNNVERGLHKTFDALRQTLEELFEQLKDKTLNRLLVKEEEAVLQQIKEELNNAEKSIKKVIKELSSRINDKK